jgi:serine protease Do
MVMNVSTGVVRLVSLAALALVAVAPFAVAREAAPLWSERPGAAPITTAPAPAWVEIARVVKPAVVNVSVRGAKKEMRRTARGLGSGFVINADGYVITNNHVVDEAADIRVKFADGRDLPGKVIGRDPKTDLALLKVEAKGLPVIPVGDSSGLEVGEPVMAVGNPFGLEQTVTTGIVSATGRSIGAGPYDDFIQTDASINPGNSGGPLINARGEVVGVNTAIASGTGGSVGIGFAIPTNMVKPIVTQLASTGRVVRGWLGVSIQPMTPELAKTFGVSETSGALVSDVTESSPAQKAGLKQGDVIVRYDGRPVGRIGDLPRAVAETPVGRTVPLEVLRDGQKMTLSVTVAQLEERELQVASAEGSQQGPRLGIGGRTLTPAMAEQLGVMATRGVLVQQVEEGGPAQTAGVTVGDVIVEVDRKPVADMTALQNALRRHAAGTPLLLLVQREGQSLYLTVAV